MTRQAIIQRTVKVINHLPQEKTPEIVDFITKKYEEQLLADNIQQLVTESKTLSFLRGEGNLYLLADLNKRHNG